VEGQTFIAMCSEYGAFLKWLRVTVKLRFRSMKRKSNIVGPKIRRLRNQRDLHQDDLAAKCGLLGWDLSRGTLAKIEAQVRCINDQELLLLAKALKVTVNDLYP
jgi:DNA-binding XRE family transcriptional regulator